jgi:N-acetylglucosamine malate deacetylase 1
MASKIKLDILAFAAHPDDAELSCSGTLIKHAEAGYKVGVVDITTGDLGTRGTPEIRLEESKVSAKIMDLSARENLHLRDGFFSQSEEALLKVVEVIRKYQPNVILANSVSDRHPDHGRGSALVSRASFLAGLVKIKTGPNNDQPRWRPEVIYHYIQFRHLTPDFVVDITDQWTKKLNSIKAFKSQFYDPKSDEPSTLIASEDFLRYVESRAREFGACIERRYGEGFTVEHPIHVRDLMSSI